MKFERLKELYLQYENKYGKKAYKYISKILKEAKEIHKIDFYKRKPDGDHEQSWRSFKGKNLEKLILFIIEESEKVKLFEHFIDDLKRLVN